jgi:soluble lytic murein transglycosylase-like protein
MPNVDPLVRWAAKRYGVSAPLIKAVIKAESDFDPNAVSSKGAQGLMQLMPDRARILGVRDSFNPAQNIAGGVRHLRELLIHFKGKLRLALAAYNAGKNAVIRYGGVPPYPETRKYVKKVIKYYISYRREEKLQKRSVSRREARSQRSLEQPKAQKGPSGTQASSSS